MAMEQITLFHTNDVHSCFDHWSHIVSYIKRHRTGNSLYIDLGDHADRSHPITEATLGKGNVQLLNEAEVNYVTIGNNEGITFSKTQLEEMYEEANFPVILANLCHPNGDLPEWTKEYIIHTFESGLKVGLIGLTAPFTFFYEQLGWEIKNPLEVLSELLPVVKEKCDIVVLISHLGLFKDEEIADNFKGIDVIIGAHTHHVLQEGKRINQTLIVQTGKHGAYLGEVKLYVNLEDKKLIQSTARLIKGTDGEEDQETNQLLKRLNDEAEQVLIEQVAWIPRRLPVDWQKSTEVVQILCDALTEWCKEKIGMLNAGVLLESFEKGWVTRGDIHRICPHPINPCVVSLTGQQLEDTLKRAFTDELRTMELKGFGFRGKVLGRMIFTGMDVVLNEDQSIQRVTVQGEDLKRNKVYNLATLDMYTFGYLFPDVADSGSKRYYMPEFLRDILTWKLNEMWPK